MSGPEGGRKRLCVFCGSGVGDAPVFAEAARELGRALARRGVGVVYGAGNIGLMGEVAASALAEGGEVIGVIPQKLVDLEVCHRELSELHVCDTMHQRKAKMHELSDAFLALPGGLGTFEELFEVLTWHQLDFHAKPVGLLDVDGYFAPLLAMLRTAEERGFVSEKDRRLLTVGSEVDVVLDTLVG